MAIDKIIEEKIKFGPAQIIPFIFLCLVDMNDGAQLVLSNLFFIKVHFLHLSLNNNGAFILTQFLCLHLFFIWEYFLDQLLVESFLINMGESLSSWLGLQFNLFFQYFFYLLIVFNI